MLSARYRYTMKSSYYEFERPELLELIPKDSVYILDVGCGAGILGATIKKRQHAVVYGVELTKEASELAAEKLDRVWNASIEDALNDIHDGTLDCIVVGDVLEHLRDPWSVLIQLKNKLKFGGKVVASIPNIQHWTVVKNLIEGKWRYEPAGLLDKTHIRFFTRRSVYELFWNAALKITDIKETSDGTKVPKRFLNALKTADLNHDIMENNGQVYQYLVVAERLSPLKIAPKVTIIILNWNGLEDTLECLNSVSKINYSNFEVIVVDNGSKDDSVIEIRKHFPNVTVFETGENLGFAQGNNVGIKYALEKNAKYILLLNNDTIVDPSLIDAFLEAAYLCSDIAFFGAKIYYHLERNTIQFAGAEWDNDKLEFNHIGNKNIDDGITYEDYRESDFVSGCALFFCSNIIDKVGYLESKFFLNYEETDWCFRARRMGYKCIVVPKAKVWHKTSVSFGGQASPIYEYFMTRNELLWANRNLPLMTRINIYKKLFKEILPVLTINLSANYSNFKKNYWSFVQYKNELLKRYNDPIYKAKLFGIIDYIFRRFGNCPDKVRELKKIST